MSYNSPVNQVLAASTKTVPTVGSGATRLGWTDRHPYTVIEVLSPRRVVLQEDTAVRVDNNGMSESQEYEFHANPQGQKVTVTLRKNGRWVEQGESIKGTAYSLGYKSKYHDFSF